MFEYWKLSVTLTFAELFFAILWFNNIFRLTQENILLLKEENQSMKKKMERFDEKMAEMARTDLENEVCLVRLLFYPLCT